MVRVLVALLARGLVEPGREVVIDKALDARNLLKDALRSLGGIKAIVSRRIGDKDSAPEPRGIQAPALYQHLVYNRDRATRRGEKDIQFIVLFSETTRALGNEVQHGCARRGIGVDKGLELNHGLLTLFLDGQVRDGMEEFTHRAVMKRHILPEVDALHHVDPVGYGGIGIQVAKGLVGGAVVARVMGARAERGEAVGGSLVVVKDEEGLGLGCPALHDGARETDIEQNHVNVRGRICGPCAVIAGRDGIGLDDRAGR